jgi:glutathione S-transferase
MLLAERDARFDFVTVDLAKRDNRQDDHLKRHPFGRVPVLKDADFTLYESRAILRYLDAVLPGTRLTPRETKEVALMEQWISVDSCYFTPAAYTIVVQRTYMPMRPPCAPSWTSIGQWIASWRRHRISQARLIV